MARQQTTRRQKNISRLLREKKQAYRETLKTHKPKSKGTAKWTRLIPSKEG